jgi:hypothetical protein
VLESRASRRASDKIAGKGEEKEDGVPSSLRLTDADGRVMTLLHKRALSGTRAVWAFLR